MARFPQPKRSRAVSVLRAKMEETKNVDLKIKPCQCFQHSGFTLKIIYTRYRKNYITLSCSDCGCQTRPTNSIRLCTSLWNEHLPKKVKTIDTNWDLEKQYWEFL